MMNPASEEAGFFVHICLKNDSQFTQNILIFKRFFIWPILSTNC